MIFTVTGATGFIGKKLVYKLLSEQHLVRVLGRNRGRVDQAFDRLVEFFEYGNQKATEEALKGADCLIHLAGEGIADHRWTTAQKDKILKSRVSGTEDLVRALHRLGKTGPKSFVCASAIGFYGDRQSEILYETSPPGTGFLAEVCTAWEKAALDSPPNVRTVSLRLGIVLGREGGFLKRVLPIFRTGMGGPLGGGRQWMSWIHRDDLVRLIIEAATNPSYVGPINAVAPHPETNANFSRKLGIALHRPAFIPTPAFILKLAMGDLSELALASQRVIPMMAQQLGFHFQFGELSTALADLLTHHELECFQWINHPCPEVFAFFSEAKNLEKITPPWLHFELASHAPSPVRDDVLINYRLKVRHLPLQWTSKISQWKPQQTFVDEQVKGPYRYWHHTHDFFSVSGGTLMRDKVRYALPRLLFLSPIAKRLVRTDLDKIFSYRRRRIQELFNRPDLNRDREGTLL